MTHSPPAPVLPFPIYQPSPLLERYLLYDVDIISWLRKTHNILGVLIGSLPQSPSQNVFLGLPVELQSEEARFLVDKGLAFVIIDLDRHNADFAARNSDTVQDVKARLQRERLEIAKTIRDRRQKRANKASKGKGKQSMVYGPDEIAIRAEIREVNRTATDLSGTVQNHPATAEVQSWSVTPSSSTHMLSSRSSGPSSTIPKVDASSYALFKHLHGRGYFITPGLRFGCQFSVYPGDPLRFHSHFLAISADWYEEIDLLHLVGGGRLGTGVKKGWMIGGVEPEDTGETRNQTAQQDKADESPPLVRTFCIEWGGM